MPIKSVKMKISKRFFLMPQGSLIPEIRFLGQKMCLVARGQTHTKLYYCYRRKESKNADKKR